MTLPACDLPGPFGVLSRREIITTALAAGPTAALATLAAAQDRPAEPRAQPSALRGSPTVYNMKKSINQWAFPYPERMTLEECLLLAKRAGFDGISASDHLQPWWEPGDSGHAWVWLGAVGQATEDIAIGTAVTTVIAALISGAFDRLVREHLAQAAREHLGNSGGGGGCARAGDAPRPANY